MILLLRHLRQANAVPPPSPPTGGGDIAGICRDYEAFLLEERCLVRTSADQYLVTARRFLHDCFPAGKVYLARLRASHVTDFVSQNAAHLGHRTVQLATSVLRNLLGFLFQKGRTSASRE